MLRWKDNREMNPGARLSHAAAEEILAAGDRFSTNEAKGFVVDGVVIWSRTTECHLELCQMRLNWEMMILKWLFATAVGSVKMSAAMS